MHFFDWLCSVRVGQPGMQRRSQPRRASHRDFQPTMIQVLENRQMYSGAPPQISVVYGGGTDTIQLGTYHDSELSYPDGTLVNGYDPDGGNVTLTIGTDAQNGSATVVDGNLIYMPNAQYVGNDTFTIQYVDEDSDTSDAVTVTVSVSNSGPQIIAANSPDPQTANFWTYHDSPVSGANYFNVYDNESDPAQLSLSDDVSNGILSFNIEDGSFNYTPNAGYVGQDSFKITATDPLGESSPEELTVTLSVSNAAPFFGISNATFHVSETALPGAIIGSVVATDVEPYDWPEYTVSQGEFEVAEDGLLRVAGTVGLEFDRSTTPEYNFTVTARDQLGASSTLNVKVIVDAPPPPPTVVIFINIDDLNGIPTPPPANLPSPNNPFGLNQDDYNRLQNDRQAWQHIVHELTMHQDAGTRAALAAIVAQAEQRLAVVQSRVAVLENMRANSTQYTKEQYYEALRDALFNYDRYLAAYTEVHHVLSNYLQNTGWWPGWRVDTALVARANNLPLSVAGMIGMITPDQFDALNNAASQITDILNDREDQMAWEEGTLYGARDACVVGAVAIGAVAFAPAALVGMGMAPTAAASAVSTAGLYVGGTAAAAGLGWNMGTRLADGQSGVQAIVGGASDTVGYTGLHVGVQGVDPVTGQPVALTPQNQGYVFGSGATQLIVTVASLGTAGGSQQVTLDVPPPTWDIALPQFQILAGNTGGTAGVAVAWETVATLPLVNVSVTSLTIGGQNVILMAGRGLSPSPSPFEEEFDSFEDAVGLLDDADNMQVSPTGDPNLRNHGYTEFWRGQAPDGTWYSAFYNPRRRKWGGGHISSGN